MNSERRGADFNVFRNCGCKAEVGGKLARLAVDKHVR